MWIYTGVLATLGLGTVVTALGAEGNPSWTLFGLFLLGVIGSSWVANFLVTRRPKK